MPCTLRSDIEPNQMTKCIKEDVCTSNTNQRGCAQWLDDQNYRDCCIWTEGLRGVIHEEHKKETDDHANHLNEHGKQLTAIWIMTGIIGGIFLLALVYLFLQLK